MPICFTIVALLARTAPDSDDAIFAMAADDPVRGPDALYITLDRGIPPSVVDRSGTVMVAVIRAGRIVSGAQSAKC